MKNLTSFSAGKLIPIIGAVAVVLLIGAGGLYYTQIQSSQDTLQANVQNSQQRESGRFDGARQGEEVSIDEVVLGEQILVIGTENQDGSITAEIIRIGDFAGFDFEAIAELSGVERQEAFEQRFEGEHSPDGQERFGGGNFEEFQHLSSEERQQRFQAFAGGAGGNFAGRRGGAALGRRQARGSTRSRQARGEEVRQAFECQGCAAQSSQAQWRR